MDIDKILEDLSQEERLALLERLVKDAAQEEKKEDLSIEERIARLEEAVYGGWRGFGPRRAFRHFRFYGRPGRCQWHDYPYERW